MRLLHLHIVPVKTVVTGARGRPRRRGIQAFLKKGEKKKANHNFDKCLERPNTVRPVRVIDIWLHSSLTLSGPTDSQYLLLSAERNNKPRSNPPMERVIEAMAIEKDRAREGGNSTFSTILFLIPFLFFFFLFYSLFQ